MLKKLLFSLCAVFIAISMPAAFAGGPDVAPPQHHFDGILAGAGVGIAVTGYRYNIFANSTTIAAFQVNNFLDTKAFDEGFLGDVHLGYGHQFGRLFYLGALVGVNFTTHSGDAVHSEANFRIPAGGIQLIGDTDNIAFLRSTEVTIDLHPGILLAPTSLLYAVVGVAFNRINYIASNSTATINAAVTGSFNATSRVEKNVEAFRVGLGLEQKVSDQAALFLQYVYSRYGSAINGATATFVPFESVTINGRVKPSRHSILFGFDWFFNQ